MKHWGIIWLLSGDCLDEALRYVVIVILVITGVIVFLFCFYFCIFVSIPFFCLLVIWYR